MQSVPITQPGYQPPDEQLRLHILAFYTPHILRAASRTQFVHDSTLLVRGVSLAALVVELYEMARKVLSGLHQQILDLLKNHPDGLTIYDIRKKFPKDPGIQQHLDRRVRDLRKYYDVPSEGGKYILKGEKVTPAVDSGAINAKLRAAVLNMAHGRCQMCGLTVADDGIKLQVDHKIPQTWGGPTTLDNLWALCQLCNGGKRDFFSSFDNDEMREIVKLESVHARLAQMLHLRQGVPVPSWVLAFVANVNDFQEDWHRRLRELRSAGIDYTYKRNRLPSGKVETTYTLTKWKPLSANHQAEIKEREPRRERRK